YPMGHTASGSPIESFMPPPPAPPPAPMMMERDIVVTAQRLEGKAMDSNAPIVAVQEELGDLKLYRVPERITVAAKGLKQVAFLDKDAVRGKLVYQAGCELTDAGNDPAAAEMRFETVNDAKHGLGVAMPMGGITFFEPSSRGDLFVGEQQLRDFASGQDVEISLGSSAQVFATCEQVGQGDPENGWVGMKATLSNANPHPVTLRLKLGSPLQWHVRGLSGTRLKDGETVYEATVPANGKRVIAWTVRQVNTDD
ncbi:MAG: hypothetical protein ACXWJC_04610, partial [Croceibacterium sp.]